jgi:hypothetical protein
VTAANSLTVTALSLINAAGQEIGALASGEQFDSDDQAWVLQKLQRVIDTANARRVMVYANVFSTFTLVPNLTPHTIGPTPASGPAPTFVVSQRPVEIPSIGLILVNTNPTTVEIPMTPRDKDWWADQRVKNLQSDIPTDYYYEPSWNGTNGYGNIWFWPVPNATNNVLLQLRTVIGEITSVSQSFTMPPAYWDWIIYKTAIAIAPSFERQISPDLRQLMMEADRAVLGNNVKSPRGVTGDAGMPGGDITLGLFNYYSGGPK